MQSYRKLFSVMFFIPLLMLGYNVAADEATPSGTVVIDETQVTVIVGGDVGGVLCCLAMSPIALRPAASNSAA